MFSFLPRTPFAVLSVALVVGVAGCAGHHDTQLVGTWKVKPMNFPMPSPKPGTSPAAAQMQQQMAKQMLSSMSLDLKADKTFTMNMIFPMEGTWAFDGNASEVQLTMKKMMGMDVSKMPNASQANRQPMVLTLSSDGTQLTPKTTSGQSNPAGGQMVFVKQ